MRKYLVIIATLCLLLSCSNDSTSPTKPVKDINDLIQNAGELPTQPQQFSNIPVPNGSKTEYKTEGGISYVSNSQQMSMTNKFDEIAAFNTTYADVLYPGAIVQGKDILDGKLTSIGDFPREPITLTLQGGASKQISNPTLATVTNGISDLLKNSTGTTAQMQYYKSELHQSEQAFLELGLDVNWLAGGLSSKFQKESSVKKNSIFLYFKQIYYTISINSFASPADYFSTNVDINQLKAQIYPGNPPCYISSVSYGRIIMVKMTSDTSYAAMESAIQGSYVIVNGKVNYKDADIMSKSTFDAVIVGGSAQGAANALAGGTIKDINKLILDEATFSPANPGFPIAFTVRYLNGGSPVKLGGSTEYWMQNWQVDDSQYQKFDIILSNFKIINDGNSWGDGDFYYQINITDKNGNILKDVNGNSASIATDINNTKETGDGENITVNKTFYGLSLKKTSGENFTINVKLFDVWYGTDVYDAGQTDITYTYPWTLNVNALRDIELFQSTGDYKTDIIFEVVKK